MSNYRMFTVAFKVTLIIPIVANTLLRTTGCSGMACAALA